MKKHFLWKKGDMKAAGPAFTSKTMKNGILNIIAVIFLISIMLTTGCIENGGSDKKPDTPADSVILGGLNQYVNSSNDFSYDMYAELNNGSDNLFFSPYSITTALGMAYEGAKGKTAKEMEDVLDFPWDEKDRLNMMKELQSLLNTEGAGFNLSTANAYWLAKSGELKQHYMDSIEQYYLAHGERLDFLRDPSGSLETINTWVEEQTNDRIKDLLSEKDIDPSTYLVLTNAIYFKSDWRYSFDSEATEETDFHLSDGTDTKCHMMHMNDDSVNLQYADDDHAQLLRLPYAKDKVFMCVLLPREGELENVESKLDVPYISSLKAGLAGEHVDIYLPKFKFKEKYRLKENLISMGMPTAFTAVADFSNMTDGGVWIDKVIHQSFVEVNEEGTEASAATAVIMVNYSIESSSGPVTFRADRPFIFLIEHEETGQILFMGKVENPNR